MHEPVPSLDLKLNLVVSIPTSVHTNMAELHFLFFFCVRMTLYFCYLRTEELFDRRLPLPKPTLFSLFPRNISNPPANLRSLEDGRLTVPQGSVINPCFFLKIVFCCSLPKKEKGWKAWQLEYSLKTIHSVEVVLFAVMGFSPELMISRLLPKFLLHKLLHAH